MRGATFIEATIALLVLMFMIGVFIDLTLGIYRRSLIQEAVRAATLGVAGMGSIRAGSTSDAELLAAVRQSLLSKMPPGAALSADTSVVTRDLCVPPPSYPDTSWIGSNVAMTTIEVNARIEVSCFFCFLWGLQDMQTRIEAPLVDAVRASCV